MHPLVLKAGMIMNLPTEDNDKAFLEILNAPKEADNPGYLPRRFGPSSLMSSEYDVWTSDDEVNRANLLERTIDESERLASARRRRRWWNIFTW